MIKVLYVAPEVTNKKENAAQVRANCLLPKLNELVDLQILGYPVPGAPETHSLAERTTLVPPRKDAAGLLSNTFFSSAPRSFYRYNAPNAHHAMNHLMEKFQPDVVHLDRVVSIVHLEAAKRARVVMQSHDCITHAFSISYGRGFHPLRTFDRWMQWRKFRRVESTLYAQADRCLVDSQGDATALRALNPANQVEVVPLGFDESIYSQSGPLASLKSPNIIFTGNMQSIVSSDAALMLIEKIMPSVWKKVPTAHLYLVGSNPPDRIAGLAQGDSRISVTGFVEDLAAFLRAGTVYVCPLQLGSGMRTRTVEALASGCPVVSTQSGLHGLSTENIEIFPWRYAETPADIARETVKLLENESEREQLGAQAAEYAAQRYSWGSVARCLVKVYEDILLR